MNLILQNLLQSLRSLRTQSWQVIISALGLAVSIVCLTFSVNWLWSETNYDAFRPDYKDLYVLQAADSLGNFEWISYSILEAEQVTEALRQHGDSAGIGFTGMLRRPRIALARTDNTDQPRYYTCCNMDVAMLRTLGVEVLSGDIDESLRNKDERIIITDHMAMQLFGRTDVVGEVLYNGDSNERHPIGAVVKANPGKSYFPYDCIANLNINDDEYKFSYTWRYEIVVRSKDIDATLRALEGMKAKENGRPLYFTSASLRTYPQLYNIKKRNSIQGESAFASVYFYQLAFVSVSLMLLLSALANLIAVNTSICLSRTREYALRRSLGGSTWQNAQWLLTGIVPTLLLTVMLSTVAWEWMLKMQWVEIDVYCATHIFWLVVLAAIVCCFIGMAYPIAKMHRIYVRSFAGSGSMGHSHGWLVAVQCVACAFLLFLSWGMNRQLHGMMNEDMGLDTRNLLRLHTSWNAPETLEKQYDFQYIFHTLPHELKKHGEAGIVDAVAVRTDIFNRTTYRSMLIGNQKLREEYTRTRKQWVDGIVSEQVNQSIAELQTQWIEQHQEELIIADFVEMEYGIQPFFGLRTVGKHQMDNSVSHTASFAQVYGDKQFMERVGHIASQSEPLYIIDKREGSERGYIMVSYSKSRPAHWKDQELRIVDEVNLTTTDFHQQRIPTIYVGVPDQHPCPYDEWDAIYIRYADGRRDDAEAAVRKVLADMNIPEYRYLLTTFEEYISKSYKEDIFYANLVTWLTVFSFLITLAGVFSTLLYTLRLQRRSMAIRRVMGAEFGDVFYGTLRPYVIYAVLGAAIAFAPAALLMNKWMSYFSYGTAPGLGLMLCILLMMLTVITLIVLWQVNKSMNEKPVDVLRPEA